LFVVYRPLFLVLCYVFQARVAKLADLPAGRQARDVSGIVDVYYVYAISSTTKKYIYVGQTNNLERRVRQHQSGKEKTTRDYRPFKVILTEKHLNRVDARVREKYYKSGSGKERLKELVS